ncbi:MAG: tyrosine-type recombinase/integrase [Actinomycetota bacterium]
MERTRHPGIYKRGGRYVVRYRAGGKNRAESARTLEEALRIKRGREAERDRGEFQPESREAFRTFAEEWVERYRGNGRRGFTDETRADYRRDLETYAYPFFADRLDRTLGRITPRDVDRWIAWLCERPNGRGGTLSDASVRRIASAVRACLATARREGLIRHNPADGAVLPRREEVEDVEGDPESHARVFTREQLDATLRVVHKRHRPMLTLLAGTGLRWGEAVALRRGDFTLDGSRPVVRVRRAWSEKGRRFKTPKSRHGSRDVRLSPELVRVMRAHLAALPPGDPDGLAFPSRTGTPLAYPNTLRRVLRPAVEEAGAAWATFHTFRHTLASLHIARGTNILQLSRLLGHHSPDFTLRVYAHLLPGEDADPLDLEAELATEPAEELGLAVLA